MTGEECKFLHPAHVEDIWIILKEVAEYNAIPTIQNFANTLGPQGNITTIDTSEYILRAECALGNQIQHATCEPNTTSQTRNTNQQ